MLIAHGADVNALDKQRRTPLMEAAIESCDVNALKSFIAVGADLSIKEVRGRTASDFAYEKALRGDQRCNAAMQVLRPTAPQAE